MAERFQNATARAEAPSSRDIIEGRRGRTVVVLAGGVRFRLTPAAARSLAAELAAAADAGEKLLPPNRVAAELAITPGRRPAG